ncbi:MAG: DUF192 domain-containing protein [Myxococcales bacterium]|nr:DUF192 domain-containing protein [Myxococcales bacterium]
MTLLATLIACAGSGLPVHTLDVSGNKVRAELAFTDQSRQNGLMNRDSMGADDGMLFIYRDEAIRGFWMKDTRIPLSIAFANRHGEIVKIADMTPFDQSRVSSLAPAMYALEMNKGWFEEHGVKKGDTIGGLPTDVAVE